MKRFTSLFLTLVLLISCCYINVLAESDVAPCASDLIAKCSLGIDNPSGTTIKAIASITATDDLEKLGISVIRIQERKNSSASWTTVSSATGVYGYNRAYFSTSISYVGVSGRQYRVTCVYYAYDNGSSDTSSITSSTFEIA